MWSSVDADTDRRVAISTLTVRNIDDATIKQLRQRAARHGRSVSEEARVILHKTFAFKTGPEVLAHARSLFSGEHGVELLLPPRR